MIVEANEDQWPKPRLVEKPREEIAAIVYSSGLNRDITMDIFHFIIT